MKEVREKESKEPQKKIHNIDINKLYLSSFDNSFRLLEEKKKDDEDLWQDDIPHNFVGVEIFDKELNIFYLSENTSYNYETDQKLINEKEKKYLINQNNYIMELSEIDKNIRDIKSYLNKINNPIENTNRNKKIKGKNVQKLSETFQSNIDKNKNEFNNNNEFKTITSSLKNYNYEITKEVENIKQNDDKLTLTKKFEKIKESLKSFKNNFDKEDNHRFIIEQIEIKKKPFYYFKNEKLDKDSVLYRFKMYLKIKSFLYLFIYNDIHFFEIIKYDNSIDYSRIIKNILNELNLNTDISGCWIYKNDLNQIDIQKKPNESNNNRTSEIQTNDNNQTNDTDSNQNQSKEIESREKINYINFRLFTLFKNILSIKDTNDINFILN